MNDVEVHMRVNGVHYRRSVAARRSLADFLREDLGHTGTHLGCEHGVCGSCTVLRNGCSVRSCLTLAAQADGSDVETVEGLTRPGRLGERLGEALSIYGGLQCGFCTPGFIASAVELLKTTPNVDESTVREALSGNVCRCTGYTGIVAAVLHVSRALVDGDSDATEDEVDGRR